MPADFTYEMYATLLDAGRREEVSFVPVREYLDSDSLEEGVVVLRHDVDRKPGNALDFARIEADRGIRSTYYVRTVEETFDPEVVAAIEGLGHEVGYHYEDLDRTHGDVSAARESFEVHLGLLREHVTVDTVCMHGNPLTPHDNRDMWSADPEFSRYDLLGEAYLSMDFTDVTYFSDTGRTWRDGALKVKDNTVGDDSKSIQVDTTQGLLRLLRTRDSERYCLLSHPDRWAGGPVERVTEAAFDTSKNLAKHVLQAVADR